MPKFSRGVLRLLGVVALAALLLPLSTELLARAPGRDFPRCIQACNEIRSLCRDRCDVDCAALFPNDPIAEAACIDACNDVCISESQDCKDVCKAIKDGTVEEP